MSPGLNQGLLPPDIQEDDPERALVILLVALALAAVTVPIARGDWTRLIQVRLRMPFMLVVAFALQFLVMMVIPGANEDLLRAIHVASYLVGGAFIVLNLRLPGIWMVALGGGLNFLAIVANAGVMPASLDAVHTAGVLNTTDLFENSQAMSNANLAFLGDIFALPAWVPFANVFSIGDICIVLGLAIFLHRSSGSRLRLPSMGEYAPLLRDANFRRVWGAQATSSLGDFVYELSIAATVATRSGARQGLAVLLVCYVGAAALAGLSAGGLLDRRSRRAILVGTDVVRAGAVLTLLVVPDQSLTHLAVVAAILGAGGAVFQAGVQASLPRLVSAEKLVAANALIALTFNAAVMIGPIIGGLAVTQLGIRPGIAINAATFVVSALLLSRARMRQEVAEPATSPAESLREGLAYVMRTPIVRRVVFVMGLVMVGTAIRAPLEPVLVLTELRGTPQTLGLLEGCWGLGMVLGALWAPGLARRFQRDALFAGGVAFVAAGTLLVPLTGSVALILILALIAGSGNGLGSVAYETLLQERTPDHLRGRVLAAVEGFLNMGFLLGAGAVAAGWLDTSVRGGFVVAGVVLAVAAVAGMLPGSRARREREASTVSA